MTEQERKQGARAAADSTLCSGAFRGVLLGLCGAALLGGCAVTSEPEAGAYGTLHTGLESKKDGVDFHAAPSGKSWAGLEGGWTFENDLEVGVALEGTLNRSSKTFGKNDVPFDRQANLSLARGEERLVVGRSKRAGRPRTFRVRFSTKTPVRSMPPSSRSSRFPRSRGSTTPSAGVRSKSGEREPRGSSSARA